MRIISYSIALVFIATLSLLVPHHAQAQTWKSICVNGGNTAGVHNNTWQKVNSGLAGGGTWKKAGGCVAPLPPPPPTCANGAANYPTCTFPPVSDYLISGSFAQQEFYPGYFSPNDGGSYASTGYISNNMVNGREILNLSTRKLNDGSFIMQISLAVGAGGTQIQRNHFTGLTTNGFTVYTKDYDFGYDYVCDDQGYNCKTTFFYWVWPVPAEFQYNTRYDFKIF